MSIARSQPYSASRARHSGLREVPSTCLAPMNFAICIPISPTPEEAPWIRMLSPFCRPPLVTTASCMVCSAIGRVAAWTQPMFASGTGKTRPQSARAYSA